MSFFNFFLKPLLSEQMQVFGNDEVGWSVKYDKDPHYVWSMKKENAILACEQRHRDVLEGKTIRGSMGFYHNREYRGKR